MTQDPPVVLGVRLASWIKGYLDRGSRPSGRNGARILFLPWYSPREAESSDTLRNLASKVDMELVFLPTHYSLTHDARLLEEISTKLCPEDLAAKLRRALQELQYTATLETAILNAIGSHPRRKVCIAVAALRSGADADTSVSRMLEWSLALGLETILVFAHRRPPGIVESIDIPLAELREEILLLLRQQALQPEQIARERKREEMAECKRRDQSAPADGHRRPSFFRRLIGRLEWLTGSAPELTATDPTNDNKDFDTDSDWADLLARFCGSNWAAADDVAKGWWPLEDKAEEYAKANSLRYMDPDNPEEREIFESRLRFLTLLQVLYPRAFEAARHELDGTDQLYRIHLILCGATAKDSLLSEALIPFWREHLADPLFCELFYACFHAIGRGRSLVERFESRSQLHGLLRVLEQDPVKGVSQKSELELLQGEHSSWMLSLAQFGAEVDPSRAAPTLVAGSRLASMMGHAKRLLNTPPTASDALQAAQFLLTVYELLIDESCFGALAPGYGELIDSLTRKAISQSRAAIRFDASLIRTRVLALRHEGMSALENLRILRRTARDELGKCAVQIEEAFVHEREFDYIRAAQLYQDALDTAEELGADELVARASSGCLRCDLRSDGKKTASTVALRARIILQIQAARTPELFPLSKRTKPSIFVSYRSETRSITEILIPTINGPEKLGVIEAWKYPLYTWADVKIDEHEDFGPTIHRRLHDSDAIVLLLSPQYFDSFWCVHELHYALGQHEVRGVPLYWAWCSNETPESHPCEFAARKEIWQEGRGIRLEQRGYQLNHVEERLRRLFARGRLLVNKPLRFDRHGSDLNQSAADELKSALGAEVDSLYRRAKLGEAPRAPSTH